MLDVVKSIATVLKTKYPNFDIINDKLEQKFSNVFYIEVADIIPKKLTFNQYENEVVFTINVFTENNDINEINNIGFDMYYHLEELPVNDFIIRAFFYDFSIFENVGRAIIKYRILTVKPIEKIYMGSYKLNSRSRS